MGHEAVDVNLIVYIIDSILFLISQSLGCYELISLSKVLNLICFVS